MAKHLARIRLVAAIVAALGGLLALYPAPALSALYTVNTTVDARDANPGDGKCETAAGNVTCSLRAAVEEANAATEPTSISLPAGTYVLTQAVGCVFRVSPGVGDYAFWTTTALCVDRDVSVVGAGADATVIDGNQPSTNVGVVAPVMLVGALATVEIRGVTIRRGNFSVGSLAGFGGGIRNSGTLTIDSSVLSDNFSVAAAGAIYNTGNLTVLRSRLERNMATQTGGAIANFANSGWPGGTVRIQDSVIAHNVGANGGGIGNFSGSVWVSGSTVHDNAAGRGGGIDNGSFNTMTLVNTTVSGNRANSGGGILNNQFATLVLNNVTVTNNTARWGSEPTRGVGGGLVNEDGASTTVRNSVIAGNIAQEVIGPDCFAERAPITSGGHNLFGDPANCALVGDATGNLTGVDPHLGLLVDNGGFAPTHAPAATSPVIDAGSAAVPGSGASACTAIDQRGFARPVGARCDMGAHERSAGFTLTKIVPRSGGNAGTLASIIVGSGFVEGAAVALRRAGEPDIAAALVRVDTGGSVISASFDLAGRTTGAWDVVVTNPGGAARVLDAAFTVATGGEPVLWADVVGVIRRPGRPSTLTIVYGNRGSVDALAVPLHIAVLGSYGFSTLFPLAPPPPQPDQVLTDFLQVPVTATAGVQGGYTNLPLLLPIVPAGFTGTLQIVILLPADAVASTLYVSLDQPYYRPQLDASIVSQLAQSAIAYAQRAINVSIPPALIPGLQQYVSSQLGLVVQHGRSAFNASLGQAQQVYSVVQLQADTAIVGAYRALRQ
jgi:CSLREA domain-containing protein